jgi:hypothetical protein
MHKEPNGIVWKLAMAFGLGLGALWIALGIIALASAGQGFGNDRTDWGVGWMLVGLFITIAGASSIIGTLWHRRIVHQHA